jgi:hypothetical protein
MHFRSTGSSGPVRIETEIRMIDLENKPFLKSTEVMTGAGMIVVGLGMTAAGIHGFLSEALAPFGVGLIISDGVSRAANAARERLRVRVRRDRD